LLMCGTKCAQMHSFSIPVLQHNKQGRFFISFQLNGKRHRYSSGRAFGLDVDPNRLPLSLRKSAAEDLCYLIHGKLREGWGAEVDKDEIRALDAVRSFTVDPAFTTMYTKALQLTQRRFVDFLQRRGLQALKLSDVKDSHLRSFLVSLDLSVSSYNHELKHISSILSKLMAPLGLSNPAGLIKKKKETPKLHKPFDDVQAVLAEIRAYNENLWLCCLLTYGCLLRPHQEIRQLTWGDFSEDMSFISLSGSRNKSGRNRIVPVSPYIAQNLVRGTHTDNIFTGSEKPYNSDYFKTLWGKYRKRSKLLQPNQTLYSFRHTGAIEIYKRTGSLTVLQQAMGHASLAVSLGYLRNLEVPMLRVEDMPRLN
ncbi:tyrosine-type recombinase/integrase, partial [Flavobacteriales bacterium]|nr:tyrosine-type recombinase/integrase [Flavobacteriales bacterium]